MPPVAAVKLTGATSATTGEIIRTLTINPGPIPRHKPTGGPKGPRKIKRTEP